MTIEELSQAFHPCTPSGLAEALWQLNCDISDLNKAIAGVRSRRDLIQEQLLNLMLKNQIEFIDGNHPRLSVVTDYDYDFFRHEGVPKAALEFEKVRK